MKKIGIPCFIFFVGVFIGVVPASNMTLAATDIELCAYSVGSPQYIWTAGHAQLINKYRKDINATPAFCGAETAVVKLLGTGKTDFGEVSHLELICAERGIEKFQRFGEKSKAKFFDALRAVYFQPYGPMAVVTLAGSGIRTFKDLKGKKISFGSAAHTGTIVLKHAMEAEGLEIGKDYTAVYFSCGSGHGPDAVVDRTIKACYCISPGKMPAVMNMATLNKIRLIGFSSEGARKKFFNILDERYGKDKHGIFPAEIPPGLYGKNQVNTEPVLVMAYNLIWATSKDQDDEVVYGVTQALFDHLDEFYKFGANADQITLEKATTSLTIPLHPGAARYFREKGLIK
ncbi:MAG: TAXI family TRAP transporter solute-binding subunit [Desulfobacteraceae bacterium]|nr:MAG: TAXI family TRAP transporter solute-binding subunit [Desulfobacteraceae bacterium]